MNLLDVNFWLALVVEDHPHHPAAKRERKSILQGVGAFCRVSQMSFLRLLNNRSVMGEAVKTQSEAWAFYDLLLGMEGVCFISEPEDLEDYWRGLTRRSTYSTKLWPDAYLAAFAQAGGHCVVTFDHGFLDYEEVEVNLVAT